MKYAIGLDYGTNSVRCVIVDTANGRELGTCVYEYPTGEAGIILDPADHNLARQNPADYLKGAEVTIAGAIAAARQAEPAFNPRDIVGIGVDTTGSTPLPVDRQRHAAGDAGSSSRTIPTPMAWLWKDHTGYAEAARDHRPGPRACGRSTWPSAAAPTPPSGSSARFCTACGRARRSSTPRTRGSSAPTGCPAVLTGTEHPDKLQRWRLCRGAQGDVQRRLGRLPGRGVPRQARSQARASCAARLRDQTYAVDQAAGRLTGEWAERSWACPRAFPWRSGRSTRTWAASARASHRGALVKIIGTSTCDMMVAPERRRAGGYPRPVRHRRRLDPAGLLRPGGGPVGGGRHLQLVRQLHPAGRQRGRLARGADGGGGEAQAGRVGPARARLEQRQPHDPGRPAAHGPAAGPDAPHHARGDLPGA